jgi:hypothetical protein
MAKDLPKMHVQTGIIWENDKVTPPDVATEFNKLLPNSTLYWIDNCGHAAMMEHPDEFNRLLEEWLKKLIYSPTTRVDINKNNMKINTAEFIISNSDVVNVPKTFT